MKLEKLVGERFKERPADCLLDSHALMIRGGYIKNMANGIYSSYPVLKRIQHKIETIIRQEMDSIDGQEVSLPVVMPAALWEESGRYRNIGNELLRFQDRSDGQYVLGMTHEEAAVHLVRDYAVSYSKYPFMIYQVQTKFRDEARPRGGLIRVREFTMKDAYSFHTSQQDLEAYYWRCHAAYERIFRRVGLPQVVSVASDSGMMGGKISHEFMLLTPIGEDSIVHCTECGYRSNMEAAETVVKNESASSDDIAEVFTPDVRTIDELCAYLDVTPKKTCKAVVYAMQTTGELVVLFLRGDMEVNEAKLRRIVGDEVRPAELTAGSGIVAGFIGPISLEGKCRVLFDSSLRNATGLVCGANKPDTHLIGLNMSRDLPDVEFSDVSKAVEGGICPHCGRAALQISRGVEVGNIFQLGDKYTRTMHMTYLDEMGKAAYPVMGCYGIGIGRLAACICEAHHDDRGPIWPMTVAPWQVQLCAVRADDPEVRKQADELYRSLTEDSIEVLFDDRSVSAGVMFADADLIGVPLRVIVSPRNMKEGCCEIVSRDKSLQKKVSPEECVAELKKMIDQQMQ